MADVADGLKPANENPWYVLMTLCGEQWHKEKIDYELASLNVAIWNAWINNEPDRNDLIPKFLTGTPEELNNLTFEDAIELRFRYEMLKRNGDEFEIPRFPNPDQDVRLNNLHFVQKIILPYIELPKAIEFNQSQFDQEVWLTQAKIFGRASFSRSKFFKEAKFDNITFEEQASFSNTYFYADAWFFETTFSERAFFNKAQFYKSAFFRFVRFSGHTVLSDAQFGDPASHADQTVSFANAHFEKPTNFRNAVFLHRYPVFDGAVLNDRTEFSAEARYWPDAPDGERHDHRKDDALNKASKESCAVIRHAVAKQGLPEDEHFFFRREMYFAGRSDNFWQNLPYRFFGLVSDYGHSILRPCLFLLGLWIIPALIYLWAMTWASVMSGSFAVSLRAFGFSFANIFKFLGFQKTYFVKEFDTLNPWLDFLSAGQTVFGFVFLFFLGLGLRQRFRLR